MHRLAGVSLLFCFLFHFFTLVLLLFPLDTPGIQLCEIIHFAFWVVVYITLYVVTSRGYDFMSDVSTTRISFQTLRILCDTNILMMSLHLVLTFRGVLV